MFKKTVATEPTISLLGVWSHHRTNKSTSRCVAKKIKIGNKTRIYQPMGEWKKKTRIYLQNRIYLGNVKEGSIDIY